MPKAKSKVTPLLTPQQAKDILARLAQDSGKVIFTTHAEERMIERDIDRAQVLRVLRRGNIVEGPSLSPKGNWEMRVEGLSAGGRIAVAAALELQDLVRHEYVIVISTYGV